MRRVRRHAMWLAPLAVAGGAWGVTIWVAGHEGADHGMAVRGGGAVIAVAGVLALVVSLAALVVAARNGRRCWRQGRAARRAELRRMEQERSYVTALAQARSLAEGIVAGKSLTPLTVWGLVLRPAETAYLDLCVGLSHLRMLPTGQCTWTPPVQAQLIASDQRLLVGTDRWLSMRYDAIAGFYPDLGRGQLTLDVDGGQPLLLTGLASAVVAVYVAAILYGREGMRRHPALASLLW